jgi:hypothetical protein
MTMLRRSTPALPSAIICAMAPIVLRMLRRKQGAISTLNCFKWWQNQQASLLSHYLESPNPLREADIGEFVWLRPR